MEASLVVAYRMTVQTNKQCVVVRGVTYTRWNIDEPDPLFDRYLERMPDDYRAFQGNVDRNKRVYYWRVLRPVALTLRTIGDKCGIGGERVRSIEACCRRRFRWPVPPRLIDFGKTIRPGALKTYTREEAALALLRGLHTARFE